MHYRLCLFFHENVHIKAHLGPFFKVHTKYTFKGPLYEKVHEKIDKVYNAFNIDYFKAIRS